jgi:hypothetical protein
MERLLGDSRIQSIRLFWHKELQGEFTMNGIVKILIFLVVLTLLAGCSGADVIPTSTPTTAPTVTLIPTETPASRTPLPTVTPILQPTPTPLSNAVYYMIVLDASRRMSNIFDGGSKWNAARATVDAVLAGLEPDANYGLVSIGGSNSTEGSDPCSEPSVARLPFSAKTELTEGLNTLESAGTGSISTAYALAQEQFVGLPRNTIRVLIYISNSSDGCTGRDEWSELQRQLDYNAKVKEDFYSEIIVVDEKIDPALQKVANRYAKADDRVNFQFLQNNEGVSNAVNLTLSNVSSYVQETVATRPTESPLLSSYTLTPGTTTVTFTPSITSTPTLTYTPTITTTPTIGPTATITPTWTPSSTPSATFTASPSSVSLLAVNYLTRNEGCQVDVQVKVTGSNATGVFYVRNGNMDADGLVSPQVTLPTGTNWVSSFSLNSILTLPGDQPQYYLHEIWFEYNGVETDHLEELICPGLFLPQ